VTGFPFLLPRIFLFAPSRHRFPPRIERKSAPIWIHHR
jgi:hypothetical protein